MFSLEYNSSNLTGINVFAIRFVVLMSADLLLLEYCSDIKL